MRILVTNDDGILAPGLEALVRGLSSIADITVVAPEMQKSAVGHGITLHKPLRLDRVDFPGAVEAYSSNGTPADCVILGSLSNLPKPDFVASGINGGANLGEEVLYSGTVSAAMEAALHDLPSVALSVCSYTDVMYEAAEKIAPVIVQALMEHPLPAGSFLNVNTPNLPIAEIEGVSLTRLGRRRYSEILSKREDPSGRPYYWISGAPEESDSADGTDINAIQHNRISVTPIHFDLTSENGWGGFDNLMENLEL